MKEELLKQLEIYFKNEYASTKRAIAEKHDWTTPKDLVDGAVKRCLGAAMFIQYCGIEYEELEIYDTYKKKLEDLLKAEET